MKKRKPKKPVAVHSRIRSALRLIFMYSQIRRDALKLSGKRCKECGSKHELQVDHIVPCGPTPGSRNAKDATWDVFIERMFCSVEGLQVLCKPCHARKTFS